MTKMANLQNTLLWYEEKQKQQSKRSHFRNLIIKGKINKEVSTINEESKKEEKFLCVGVQF